MMLDEEPKLELNLTAPYLGETSASLIALWKAQLAWLDMVKPSAEDSSQHTIPTPD